MLQKEVADRLVAPPGTHDYGVLTVLLGRRARMTHLLTLPPGAFRPPPKVTSAVVRLDFLADADVIPAPSTFDTTVRGLFTRRRKTLGNSLAAYAGVPGATAAEWLRRDRHRSTPASGDADDRGVRDRGRTASER